MAFAGVVEQRYLGKPLSARVSCFGQQPAGQFGVAVQPPGPLVPPDVRRDKGLGHSLIQAAHLVNQLLLVEGQGQGLADPQVIEGPLCAIEPVVVGSELLIAVEIVAAALLLLLEKFLGGQWRNRGDEVQQALLVLDVGRVGVLDGIDFNDPDLHLVAIPVEGIADQAHLPFEFPDLQEIGTVGDDLARMGPGRVLSRAAVDHPLDTFPLDRQVGLEGDQIEE